MTNTSLVSIINTSFCRGSLSVTEGIRPLISFHEREIHLIPLRTSPLRISWNINLLEDFTWICMMHKRRSSATVSERQRRFKKTNCVVGVRESYNRGREQWRQDRTRESWQVAVHWRFIRLLRISGCEYACTASSSVRSSSAGVQSCAPLTGRHESIIGTMGFGATLRRQQAVCL